MKICIVCDDVFPALGGRGKATERWAIELVKRGHKVMIFSARNWLGKKRENIHGIEIYKFASFRIPWTLGKMYLGFPYPPNNSKILKREKVDVVLVNSQFFLSFMTMFYAKSLNIPVVAAIHTQPENITKMIKGTSVVNTLVYDMIINVANLADRVIVPSKFGAELTKRHGLKKEPIVISNGIDLNKFDKNTPSGEFKKHYNLNGKIILYVGRLMAEKNVGVLVKAFPFILKNIKAKLVIIGEADHEDAYSINLKTQAKENSNIILTGFLTGKPLQELYSNAGIFVLPSYYEGLPIVLLEALSYGLSCIASDIPANKNVKLSTDRYFKAGNTIALAQKIQSFIDKPVSDENKIKQRSMITAKYNWENIAEEIFKVYHDT